MLRSSIIGAGNDTFVVNASNLQTLGSIAGGAGNDSGSFTGDLSGGYVFGGADEDTLNFSAGVNNGAVVSVMLNDLMLFSSTIAASQVLGGSGGSTWS